MFRFVSVTTLAAIAVCSVSAQQIFGGWWTVKATKIKRDGTRSERMLRIPYWVEPVGKTRDQIRESMGVTEFGRLDSGEDTRITVYNNDRSDQYLGGTGDANHMASALDDINISSNGVGGPTLDQLKVGWVIPDRNPVFAVFGFYDTFVSGRGPGESAFDDVLVDTFGGPFTASAGAFPQVPGTYAITFGTSISSLGITFPDTGAYFFQQFRQGSHTGSFRTDWEMFFSGGAGPSIGSSADTFYYDADLNGIYDEQEQDQLGTEPGNVVPTNFMLGLDVETDITVDILPPTTAAVVRGMLVSGNVFSAWTDNSVYFVGSSATKKSDYIVPIQMEFGGTSSSTTPQSLQIVVDAKTSAAGKKVRLALFNYSLNTYQTLTTENVGTTDTLISKVVTGTPLNQYVNANSDMKLRVDFVNSNGTPFTGSVDYVQFRIGS
jgi:hypothetical protein